MTSFYAAERIRGGRSEGHKPTELVSWETMAPQFRTWWQDTIAATIVSGGTYYLMGLLYRHPWSPTEFALAMSSWSITYAAIAWYRARRRNTTS